MFETKPEFYWTIRRDIGADPWRKMPRELEVWAALREAVKNQKWWYATNIVRVCLGCEGRLSKWQVTILEAWIAKLRQSHSTGA